MVARNIQFLEHGVKTCRHRQLADKVVLKIQHCERSRGQEVDSGKLVATGVHVHYRVVLLETLEILLRQLLVLILPQILVDLLSIPTHTVESMLNLSLCELFLRPSKVQNYQVKGLWIEGTSDFVNGLFRLRLPAKEPMELEGSEISIFVHLLEIVIFRAGRQPLSDLLMRVQIARASCHSFRWDVEHYELHFGLEVK